MKMDTPKKLCNNIVFLVITGLMYSSLMSVSDADCVLPEDLKNTVWEYNYTSVASNAEESTNLYIANTTLPDSIINLNDGGSIVNTWTCINSLNISDTSNVVVFKSDASFPDASGSRRLYLCMKLTKVTPDLFYFHLLSDTAEDIFPNERVFIVEADNAPADNASICSTFCQYTESPKIRTLRRQGSSVTLPSNVSLCEPCNSTCEEETTQITTLPSTSTDIDTSTEMITTPIATTIKTKSTDASCSLPEDLRNAVWEYNYTSDNLKLSTNLNIATTTLQDSVINLEVQGTILNDWTCVNSLNISNTKTVAVFKSDRSFSIGIGNNMWLYLCMKLTKITTDLYYFYLLSDTNAITEPEERAFMSADNYPPSSTSTVCQYTDSPKIRTLRRQGTNDVLPNDVALCEPWDSACDIDDMCDPNPCQNNGTCVDLTDSFNCTCAPGWKDDNCTTVMTCDSSNIVPHTTNISSGNELDDTITFSCAVGYEHISGDSVITCRSDGKWDGTPMNCAPVTCPNPPVVTFATKSSQTGSNYLDKITYTCDKGYERTGGNLVRTCKEDKKWDRNPPVCSKTNTITTILKRNSGPIVAGGLMSFGFLIIPVVFCCLLKGRSRDKYMDTSTNDVTNSKDDEDYHVYDKPSETYQIYRGRQFGYEKTSIQQ